MNKSNFQKMILTPEIKISITNSILCWLATTDRDGQPNVSPKEMFMAFGDDRIIIANIASPQTVKNIRQQPLVAVSFIDILVQKGYQLKGKAQVIGRKDAAFAELAALLEVMTGGKFPFATLTLIVIEQVKPIVAPRYLLYPETTEEAQIAAARKQYGI
ncbi:pyridoxamine 5'-phosphate oxidase family protein [Lewinella cohaerens]|uniref:pyridoxamine 5'-phosphate oxidase family protein n=1 Tax=Lewinella cohaerens TaxID=70995 RepID=UPI0003765A68|nr:pyridoxamine 5'-phosphate oxidase family protein [Lewinella cohaerens]